MGGKEDESEGKIGREKGEKNWSRKELIKG